MSQGFFQSMVPRLSSVVLYFWYICTQNWNPASTFSEDAPGSIPNTDPRWQSLHCTGSGLRCMSSLCPTCVLLLAICMGDLREKCLCLWLPLTAGLVLGHLVPCQGAWSWPAVLGHPGLLRWASRHVWTLFKWWASRLACAWCDVVGAFVQLQKSGLSWKLHQSFC